jgi:hypothetical protein
MICMRMALLPLAMLCLGQLTLATRAAEEQPPLEPTRQWQGSVADEKLGNNPPEVITDEDDFEDLWKKWKLEGKTPEVDFKKNLVVVATTRGSRISLKLKNEAGNLRILALSTRDLRPGFRYILASVPRAGIKTVEGKAIE